MKKFFGIFLCLLTVLFALMPASVKAQTCETLFEVITTLRPPTFGFPTVWDAKYSLKDSITQIASGVTVEGGTVFVVGRRISKEDFRPKEIVLAELNRRGRALKEHKYPAKEAEQPVKMIDLGQEYLVISNMLGGKQNAEKWARLSWYDKDGKYRREKILKDPAFNYEGLNLVHATEGQGFIAMIKAVNRASPDDMNSVLMRFTPQGGLVWRRAYRPGIPNVINTLVPIDEKNYISGGEIKLEDGRMASWAMKLGYDGTVHWQRTYPRGAYSTFTHAAMSVEKRIDGRGFLMIGSTDPIGGGNRAAWMLAIDALGEPEWQRYYRRDDYAIEGGWVTTEDDGRIVMVMNAGALEGEEGFDHVRMITLSPRGVLLGDESYYEGLRATATDFTHGWNGERVFTAVIDEDMNATGDEKDPIVVVGLVDDEQSAVEEGQKPVDILQMGWVFIATALDPYEDPCRLIQGR